MTRDDIIRKLTSRKFWAAVAEFVTMLIIAFHGTQETATQVAALIMAGAAVVAYIIGEGLADAAGAASDQGTVLLAHPDTVAELLKPPEGEEPVDGDGDGDD